MQGFVKEDEFEEDKKKTSLLMHQSLSPFCVLCPCHRSATLNRWAPLPKGYMCVVLKINVALISHQHMMNFQDRLDEDDSAPDFMFVRNPPLFT